MNRVEYNRKSKREHKYLANRSNVSSTPRELESYNVNDNGGVKKNNIICKAIIISVVIIIIIGIVTGLIIFFGLKGDKKDSDDLKEIKYSNNPDTAVNTPIIIDRNFKKITLDQISKDNITVEGMNETIYLYKKSFYEVYVYKEYPSGKENGINYSKKKTYAISLLKSCLSSENEIDNCSEGNDMSTHRNLASNDENKNLCLINITNDNIILSVKCPKTTDEKIKSEIISDSQYLITNRDLITNNNKKSCGYNCFENKNIIKHSKSKYTESISRNKSISNTDGYINTMDITVEVKDIENSDEKSNYYDNYIKKTVFNQTEEIKNIDKNEIESEKKVDDEEINNEITLFKSKILDYEINIKNKIDYNNGILRANLILKNTDLEKSIPYLNKSLDQNFIKTYYNDIKNIKMNIDNLVFNIKPKMENLIDNIIDYFNYLKGQINIQSLDYISNIIKNDSSNPKNDKGQLNSAINNLEKILSNISEYNAPYSQNTNQKITKYLKESSQLINNNITESITKLNNDLNSQDNIYTKIANYYLNDTSTSMIDIFNNINDIFNNYYIYESKSINSGIQAFLNTFEKDLNSKIKKDIDMMDNYFGNNNEINNITSIISNIIKNIKQDIENKKIIKENGYYISDNEINNNSIKYNEILNETKNSISKLDINDQSIIDKKFDEIINSFKDNFTELLKYLEDEKNNNFPLVENILKDNYFSPDEEKKINQDFEMLSNDIISQIKNNPNLISKFLKEIKDFINNTKSDLNSKISDINIICSNESLKSLLLSYEKAIKNYLNVLNRNVILYIKNYYQKYKNNTLIFEGNEDSDKISKYINYDYYNAITIIKNYINHTLISDLKEEVSNIVSKIKDYLDIIRNTKLNKKYDEIIDLSFINENINKVDELYENISFFKEEFDNILEKELNTNIEAIKRNITTYYDDINSIDKRQECNEWEVYITLKQETYCKNLYEYDKHIENINYIFFEIKNDNNFISFKTKFEEFYNLLNDSINYYKSTIEKFFSSLSEVEAQLNSQKNILDFNPFKNKIESLLSEKFGAQLIKQSYQYYKNHITDTMQNILNEFLVRTNNTFDDLAAQIVENNSKFKTSLSEFGLLSLIYESIITQNLTRNYFDLIVDDQKNSFNYSISYYYNRLLNLVNSTYIKIINNLPINEYGLNSKIDEYKKIIDNNFDEFFTTIKNSKKDSLNNDLQLYILAVPRTNFFLINSILSDIVLKSRKYLEEKTLLIQSLDNDKNNNEYMLISKFYQENSNNGKLIKEIYKIVFNDFEFLNKKLFKQNILDNLEIDKNEFINKISKFLYYRNLKNEKEFKSKNDQFIKIFENEFANYFTNDKKEGISDKINNLYNNKFIFSENNINEIYKKITAILEKIIFYLKKEANDTNKLESFKNDDSKIKQQLDKYKNEIFNKIENEINKTINDYKDQQINKIYTKVENDLNNYFEEVQKNTKNYYKDMVFLNSSYNIGKTIDNIIGNLVYKYKNLTQILIEMNHQNKLIELININEIKNFINIRIDTEFNYTLKNALEKCSGEKEYDFNSSINSDIESNISSQLNNIENIFSQLYSNNEVSVNELNTLDLNKIHEKIEDINKTFDDFVNSINKTEEEGLNKLINSIALNYFNISLNNAINLFGNQFLERYMNYNKKSKISTLNNYIQYSLVKLLLYYEFLYKLKSDQYTLPKDLIDKMYKINDIEDILEDPKNETANLIESQTFLIKEEIKDEIIQKYISEIKDDTNIKTSFNDIIIQKINVYLDNINKSYFEDIYSNIINKSLKELIIDEYSKEMTNLNSTIKKLSIKLKEEMEPIIPKNTNDNNEELNNINQKLNKVVELIEEYKNYNNSFNLSHELSFDMSNYYYKKINSTYDYIKKKIIDSKNSLNKDFDDEISKFNNLNINNFISISNKSLSSIINDFNNIKNSINIFSDNLSKIKLDDENETSTDQDNEEDNNFQKLLNIANKTRNFIKTYEYDKKLNHLIKEFNNSFEKSIELIEKENMIEEQKNDIINKLSKSNENYINYLNKLNDALFDKFIILNQSIYQIDNLLINASKKEKIIRNKKIKSFEKKLRENKEKNKDKYIPINHDITNYFQNYKIKTKIIVNQTNEFDINFEDDNSLNVNLKNQTKPEKLEMEINKDSFFKIFLTLDFIKNKYKIELEKCKIEKDDSSNTKECINKTKEYSFKYSKNKNINILHN